MLSRARRLVPALLLASALPLSLSACEGEGGGDKAGGYATADSPADTESTASEDPGDGGDDGTGSGDSTLPADPGGDQDGDSAGRSDVGPCDDKTRLESTIGDGTEDSGTGSVVITVRNTGSGPCVLPKVLDLALWNVDDAELDLNVQVYNSDSEVALASNGTASATLNYPADPDAAPVAAGELELDGIGDLAVDRSGGTVNLGDGTVQLTSFETD